MYKWTVTWFLCYTSSKFDEKLRQHISQELADDASWESDTS